MAVVGGWVVRRVCLGNSLLRDVYERRLRGSADGTGGAAVKARFFWRTLSFASRATHRWCQLAPVVQARSLGSPWQPYHCQRRPRCCATREAVLGAGHDVQVGPLLHTRWLAFQMSVRWDDPELVMPRQRRRRKSDQAKGGTMGIGLGMRLLAAAWSTVPWPTSGRSWKTGSTLAAGAPYSNRIRG